MTLGYSALIVSSSSAAAIVGRCIEDTVTGCQPTVNFTDKTELSRVGLKNLAETPTVWIAVYCFDLRHAPSSYVRRHGDA